MLNHALSKQWLGRITFSIIVLHFWTFHSSWSLTLNQFFSDWESSDEIEPLGGWWLQKATPISPVGANKRGEMRCCFCHFFENSSTVAHKKVEIVFYWVSSDSLETEFGSDVSESLWIITESFWNVKWISLSGSGHVKFKFKINQARVLNENSRKR